MSKRFSLFTAVFFLLFASLIFSDSTTTTLYNSTNDSLGMAANITFDQAGSDTSVYLQIPKNSTVINGSMDVSGYAVTNITTDSYTDAIIRGYSINYSSVTGVYPQIDVENWTKFSSGDTAWTTEQYQNSWDVNERFYLDVPEDIKNITVYWQIWVSWYPQHVIGSDAYFNISVYDYSSNTWTIIDGEIIGSRDQYISKTVVIEVKSDFIQNNKILMGIRAKNVDPDTDASVGGTSNACGGSGKVVSGLCLLSFRYTSRERPTNLSIDTANDLTTDWSMTGKLNSANSPQNITLNITAIQNYVDTNEQDANGFVCVPLNISSDTAGIVELSALSIYADDTATADFVTPTPANGTIQSENFIYINVTSDRNQSNFTLKVNRTVDYMMSMVNLSSDSYGYYNLTGLSEGVYNFTVYVQGNQSVLWEITIDDISPGYAVVSPVSDYNQSTQSILFNFTATDVRSANVTFDLTIDGLINQSDVELARGDYANYTFNFSEGMHNWSFKVWDNVSNANMTSTYTFTVDLEAPTLANASRSPESQNSNDEMDIRVNVADNLLDIDSVLVEIKSLAETRNYTMTLLSGNTYQLFRVFSGTGSYNISNFYANDTASNLDNLSSNLTFTISQAVRPGGSGGGTSKVTAPAFKERLSVIKSDTMAGVIKELKLEDKRFCRVKKEIAAIFALTGWNTGDYPAPTTDISGILTNPIVDMDTGDVYETSASEVLKVWSSSDTVVIARGDMEVDSIAAIAYARAENIPILLTKPGELPSATLDAVKNLSTNDFVIIGGEGAISDEVAAELSELGGIKRIAGENRQETALEVAKELEKINEIDTIVIADGAGPSVDAAIISAGYNAPVLYIRGDFVPQSVKDFIKAHRTTKNGKEVKLIFVDISGYLINYRLDDDF